MGQRAALHHRISTADRSCDRVAALFGGLCVAPHHHAHFKEPMRDMGARTKPGDPPVAYLAPLGPRRYAGLFATAPGHAPAARGTTP